MLKAQSLKINHILQALNEQGFNTSAIARQEKEIAQTFGQQDTLVGEILTLHAQQQQLSRQIAEAASVSELDTISRLMEAFRSNVRKLNRHREDLAEQVRSQTAELHALVLEHRQAARRSGKGQRGEINVSCRHEP